MFVPAKVLIPDLSARIKQPYDFTRNGIARSDSTRFAIIAHGTGEPKIGFFRRSALGFGNEMVDLHQRTDDCLRGKTITQRKRASSAIR